MSNDLSAYIIMAYYIITVELIRNFDERNERKMCAYILFVYIFDVQACDVVIVTIVVLSLHLSLSSAARWIYLHCIQHTRRHSMYISALIFCAIIAFIVQPESVQSDSVNVHKQQQQQQEWQKHISTSAACDHQW